MAAYSSMLAWISHGQRSLAGYSPEGCKESDVTEANTLTHICIHKHAQIQTYTRTNTYTHTYSHIHRYTVTNTHTL